MAFSGDVAGIAAEFSGNAVEAGPRAYLLDPDRAREAEQVGRLVERFIDYELHPPTDRPGIGRYASHSMIPPFADLLGRKRVATLGSSQLSAAREAAAAAIANGYAGLMPPEAEPGSYVDGAPLALDDLWTVWVVRLNGDDALTTAGLDDSFQNAIRHNAEAEFVTKLRQAGLFPKVRKRMRYGLLGQWYGKAGMLLRLYQRGGVKGDPEVDLKAVLSTWPLEVTS